MEEKVFNVTPINPLKKFLVWLCGLIITFFFAFVIANFASIPLGKNIIGYDKKSSEITAASNMKISILKGNKLLFAKEGDNTFDNYFQTTFDYYLSYYVIDSDISNEIFHTYYVDIIHNSAAYGIYYNQINLNNPFFDIDNVNNVIKMKESYKTMFAPYFISGDELSENAKAELSTFKNRVYTQLYSQMISDISKNDLSYNDTTYNTQTAIVNKCTDSINNMYIISTYIGYFLAIGCCFAIVPYISKRRKSLASLFLRNTRIDANNFNVISKTKTAYMIFYQILLNGGLIVFIPVMHSGLSNAIALTSLMPVSAISLIFSVISYVVYFVSSSSQSLCDLLTKSIVVSDDVYDQIEDIKNKNGRVD